MDDRDEAHPPRAALTRVARLVVPVALAVTAVSLAASALSGTTGCGSSAPADAPHDTGPDVPII